MGRRDQAVLITGATRGIGRATALHLARRGHQVFATGRNQALLAALERESRAEDLRLVVAPLDVRNAVAAEAAVGSALRELGRIDALVNNAGYGLSGFLEELTLEEVRAVFETNFFAALRMSQLVLPHMRERRSGTIVNVGSVAGQIGAPMEGAYAASKFALHAQSRVLRMEVATFGVRVVLIEPGVIKTDFQENKAWAQSALQEGSPYAGMRERTHVKALARQVFAQGPEGVAVKVRQAIESRAPRARYAVGIDARAGALASRLLPDAVLDFLVRRAVLGE